MIGGVRGINKRYKEILLELSKEKDNSRTQETEAEVQDGFDIFQHLGSNDNIGTAVEQDTREDLTEMMEDLNIDNETCEECDRNK